MTYLSLYRKWRPGSLKQVLGQNHVTETLTGALKENRVAHAYLFSGPRGTGKTSTARILAKALNCERTPGPQPCGECTSCVQITEGTALDVFEMDAASHTSVDDVREIRDRVPFATAGAQRKVYIIDEAHQLSNPAFNALLKMLEEPPEHVVFILCTTESHRLPATVVSRCQRFEFRRLTSSVMVEHLTQIAEAEKIEADTDALKQIVRHSQGSARDALSLLDQAAGMAGGKVSIETLTEILGQPAEDALIALSASVANQDVAAVFRQIEEMMAQGWDPRHLLRQLLEEFRGLFLASQGATDLVDADDERLGDLKNRAESFVPTHLDWILRVLGEAQADVRASTHPRLTLEVTLARASSLESEDTRALTARLERLERVLLTQARVVEPDAPPIVKPNQDPATVPIQPPISPPEQKAESSAIESGLEAQWKAMLEAVREQSRVTFTHLDQGWPLEIRNGALVTGYEKEFHPREILDRPKHLAIVTTALHQVFGESLRFEFEVKAKPNGAQEPTNESPDELVVRSLKADLVEELDA